MGWNSYTILMRGIEKSALEDHILTKKALLVDDSKSARIVLSRLLQKYDFEVDAVESGEAALEYLGEGRPDAIFIDYMMDGMDGLEAIGRIKNTPEISNIPVVMCTANEGEEHSAAAIAKGAIGILSKPPTKDKLSSIIAVIKEEIDALKLGEVRFHAEEAQTEGVAALALSAEELAELVSRSVLDAVDEQIRPLVESTVSDRLAMVASEPPPAFPDMLELQQEVIDEVVPKLENSIHEVSKDIVDKMVEERFTAQWNDFEKRLEDRLSEFHTTMLAELPKNGQVIMQIRDVAESAVEATATETASRIARDIASDIAIESTEELLNEALQEQMDGSNEGGRAKKQLMGITYLSLALSTVAIGLALYL